MVVSTRSPVNFEGLSRSASVTSRGGLVLYLELLLKTRLLAKLPAGRSQGWHDGQMILALVLLNVAGLDSVSDIERLEEDRGLVRLVRSYEGRLLGVSKRALGARFRGGRERCFPSPRSLRDWLDRFHDPASCAHRGEAWVPSKPACHGVIDEVFRRLVARGVAQAAIGEVTIDLDATVIASGKRDCLATYRAATGKVPGERGYQPLVAFVPEIGMAPWVEMRDGNVPASWDNDRGVLETLERLPAAVERVWLRTDGAGYQDALVRLANDPSSRSGDLDRFGVIGFVCGAQRSPALMAQVDRLAGSAWQEQADGTACAELPFVSKMAVAAKRHHRFRYVVSRRPLEGTLGVLDDQIPARQGQPAFEVHALLTNIPSPDDAEPDDALAPMTAGEIVAWAHDRCGRGEEVHAVLKNDMAAGLLPSGRIGANGVWLEMAALALNLTALLRRAALGEGWLWRRMKSLRAALLLTCARISRHAGRIRVRVHTPLILEAQARLAAIPPPA